MMYCGGRSSPFLGLEESGGCYNDGESSGRFPLLGGDLLRPFL